jgi:carnitine-CoA ligase
VSGENASTLPWLVAQVAREHPDRELLVEVDGGSRSYAEFDVECRRWAAALQELGIRSGDCVAVMLPTSIAAYSVWLGVSWLHAIEVPVNTAYRHRILSYLLNNCAASVLVISERYLARVAEIADELEHLKRVVIIPDGHAGSDGAPSDQAAGLGKAFELVRARTLLEGRGPLGDRDPPLTHELCCVMYTSGTTGPSKGVLMPWGLLRSISEKGFPDDPDEGSTTYSALPVFHIGGKMFLYSTVRAHGRLVLRDGFDTNAFWADVRRYDVRRTSLVGAMPNFLFRQPEDAEDRETPLRDVFMVPVIPEYRAFEERFGVRVCTAFGMTEVGNPIGAPWGLPNHRTCGRVLPGYQVRVVDDLDYEVGPGVSGELVVRSDEPWKLNLGYFGMDAVTAASWRNGWFHTGDEFTFDDDGWFYFVDRKKDAIRRRGENISSFEVEAEVLAHDDIAEVAAVAVPADEGEDEIKIVIALKPGRSLTPEDLIRFLIPRMARFMVPRYIEVVDELPKTPTAKVRKVVLREQGVTQQTFDRVKAGIEVPK